VRKPGVGKWGRRMIERTSYKRKQTALRKMQCKILEASKPKRSMASSQAGGDA
jgi:hypothetical protein